VITTALLAIALQIENYLPGSPARLQPQARQLLEAAQAQFDEATIWQLDLREGSARWRYQFILGQGAWRSAMTDNRGAAQGAPAELAWLPATELEFEARIAACTPLLHWVGADPAAPARRTTPLSADEQVDRRWLETTRDGWEHRLQLDANFRPVAWTSRSDLAWGRPAEISCQVISWQALQADQLPDRDLVAYTDTTNRKRAPAQRLASTTPQEWFALPAEQALTQWLHAFSTSRGIDFEAEVSMRVGDDEQATEYGRLALASELIWPAYGQLELQGEVGIGEDARVVHTQVRGDGSRYWHWNRNENECKQMRSLADMLAGLQGVLPLYAWAARDLPATSWQARWDDHHPGRLHCVDGPHDIQFDFDSNGALQSCTVVARDARPGAPRMIYRVKTLDAFSPAAAAFAADWRRDGFGAAVAAAEQAQAKDDSRLTSLLQPGVVAPSAAWQESELTSTAASSTQHESVQDFTGRWLVVCFFNADPWTSGPVLRELHRLRGKLDRDADQLTFRAVGCQGSEEGLHKVWSEAPLAIPFRLAQSRAFHRQWQLRWYPCTYLIAPNGNIVDRWLGMPGTELEQRLERELRAR